MKTISKFAIVAAAAAVAVAAVRRYDLVNRGAALAEEGIERAATGAQWATAKAIELASKVLDQFTDQDDLASDPTGDDDVAAAYEAAARFQRGPGGTAGVGYGETR